LADKGELIIIRRNAAMRAKVRAKRRIGRPVSERKICGPQLKLKMILKMKLNFNFNYPPAYAFCLPKKCAVSHKSR